MFSYKQTIRTRPCFHIIHLDRSNLKNKIVKKNLKTNTPKNKHGQELKFTNYSKLKIIQAKQSNIRLFINLLSRAYNPY